MVDLLPPPPTLELLKSLTVRRLSSVSVRYVLLEMHTVHCTVCIAHLKRLHLKTESSIFVDSDETKFHLSVGDGAT